MTTKPSRSFLARFLAVAVLAAPAACGDENVPSFVVPPEDDSGGSGGAKGKAGSSAGGTTGVSSGAAGTASCAPLPAPAPTSQDYCYVSADVSPPLLGFCSGYPGAVRFACADGKVYAYDRWPATSPCTGEGSAQKNCAAGAKAATLSPYTDPCPTIGGAAGAGGADAGGSGGSAGGGAAGAPPANAFCTTLATTEVGNESPGIDPEVFLRCVGVTVNNGSAFAITRYGSVVASIDGGVGKCCLKATTQEPAPACKPQ